MQLLMRVFALIIGLLAAALGLVINFLYSATHDVLRLAGTADTTTHGWIGLGLAIVGFVGAITALFWPWVSAVLMLIAGIGLCFVLHWFAIFTTPFFFIAAAMLYIGETRFEENGHLRRRERPTQQPATGTVPPTPLPS